MKWIFRSAKHNLLQKSRKRNFRSFSLSGLSGAVDHFLMSYSNQMKVLHGEMAEGGVSSVYRSLTFGRISISLGSQQKTTYSWTSTSTKHRWDPLFLTQNRQVQRGFNGFKQMKKLASVIDVENVHLVLCLHQRSTGAKKLKIILKNWRTVKSFEMFKIFYDFVWFVCML